MQLKKEFIELSRKEDRSEEEETTLIQMKKDMAARLLAAKPEEVYNAKVL